MTRPTILALLGVLLVGCATPVPYAPNHRLIQQVGADEAISRLTALLLRTIVPLISDIKEDTPPMPAAPPMDY